MIEFDALGERFGFRISPELVGDRQSQPAVIEVTPRSVELLPPS